MPVEGQQQQDQGQQTDQGQGQQQVFDQQQQDQGQGQTQQTQQQQAQQQAAELGITKAQLAEWGITTTAQLAAFIKKTPEVYARENQRIEQQRKQRQQQQAQTSRGKNARIIDAAYREHVAAGGDPAEFFAALHEVSVETAVEEATQKTQQMLAEDRKADEAEKAAHDEFWSDPANADLQDSYWSMRRMVEKDGLKPSQAAKYCRDYNIKDRAEDKPKRYGGGGLNSPHYEGNRDDPGRDEPKPDPQISGAKKLLEQLKQKPEGQRGSKAMFGIFGKNRWAT